MSSIKKFAKSFALSSLLLTAATPVFAGEKDRAQQSIAEADAKVAASLQAGGATAATSVSTEAQASLREARVELGRGHKREAINLAMKASALADRAMADAQKVQGANNAAVQAQTQAAVGEAQADAAAANARANAAQEAAQQAAADAAAARNAPPVVIATPAPAPAPAQTSVTTSTQTSAATVTSGSGTVRKAPVRKRTTVRTTRTTPKVTTTTTVKTGQ